MPLRQEPEIVELRDLIRGGSTALGRKIYSESTRLEL